VLAVCGATDYLTIGFQKLLFKLRKTTNFGWAHESKIEGIEKQTDPFATIVFERYFFKLSGYISWGFEFRRGLSYFKIPHWMEVPFVF
jgi:hypothetical protein